MLREGKSGAAVGTSAGNYKYYSWGGAQGMDHWGDLEGTSEGVKDGGTGQGQLV